MSGVADSPDQGESWAVLLGSGSSLTFLLPAEAVLGLLAITASEAAAASVDELSPRDAGSPSITFNLRVDAQSKWHDTLARPVPAEEFATTELQLVVTIELDAADQSKVPARLVTITIGMVNDVELAHDMPPDFVSRTDVASDSSLPDFTLMSAETRPAGLPIFVSAGTVNRLSVTTFASAGSVEEFSSQRNLATSSVDLANSPAAVRGEWTDFDDVDFGRELTMTSARSFADSISDESTSGAKSVGISSAVVSGESPPASFDPADLFAVIDASNSAGLDDLTAVVILPAAGLQAAAAPLIAVVETVLASLDTAARALLALLTGSGGGTSPIAPVVQPVFDSTPVMIDSKRPRWALHNGLVEELAAYSLIVAPDQHFDLKDFGPASRAADPVVRIEFDVPPQHGQVSATEVPGSFRYSADPGFSGVDTARFRVTRVSGQTVAGAVTMFVGDRGLPEGRAPVRQVELPAEDRRVSEHGAGQMRDASATTAIDTSFRLSGSWMDLP